MPRSREGWHWAASEGLTPGLPTQAVIEPAQSIASPSKVYDVLVIGAGYAGLTATRDLAAAGLKTLLLESRDRIGGRTWTSEVAGYPYEMGGTWVHWFQPHVSRELSRYGLQDQLKRSTDFTRNRNFFTFKTADGERTMSHEEEDELHARAMAKFANVDGKGGREVMPFPYDQYRNPDVWKYAGMSVADRMKQIEHELSSEERHAILSFLMVSSGGTPENSALLDLIRWWAAANYDFLVLQENCVGFKLKCGQTAFARRFFDEAESTGNLEYSFSSTVTRIVSSGAAVEVHVKDGQVYRAKRVVCTVPLNVLNEVSFEPPLEDGRIEAARLGHVNQSVKVHAEIRDPEMRSWSGEMFPHNKFIIGIGDGTTPAGKTHCVFFGGDHDHLHPEDDIESTKKAINAFMPMDVDRLVFHNWSRDEFAKGAWTWFRPGFEAKYLESLRRRHGSILFASTDWASGGWRGFIDGAIESGTEVARIVLYELSAARRSSK